MRLWAEGEARRSGPGAIHFEVAHPGLEEEPLEVRLYRDGRPFQSVVVGQPGPVSLEVDSTLRTGEILRLELSRTWSPLRYSVSADPRELGALFTSGELEDGVVDFRPGAIKGERRERQRVARADSERERGNP
jgi:hypothetical protein